MAAEDRGATGGAGSTGEGRRPAAADAGCSLHAGALRRGGNRPARRSLALTIGLTVVIMLAEIAGGFWANSLALLSDAGHMLTDALALGMALFAVTVSTRPATSRKTYGYHRIEILSALSNGVVLVVIALGIFYEAWRRFADPQPVAGGLVMAVSAVGLAANLAGMWILGHAGGNLNVRSARMHVLSDALSSAGVLGAGIVISVTRWYRIDSMLSFVIAIVILVGAFRILRETVDILLESTPMELELEVVCRAIEDIRGVKGVHDLHIWSITSGMTALSGHIILENVMLADSDAMLNRIKEMLTRRFGIDHTTLQVESEAYTEVGEVH